MLTFFAEDLATAREQTALRAPLVAVVEEARHQPGDLIVKYAATVRKLAWVIRYNSQFPYQICILISLAATPLFVLLVAPR